jgi:hypothetical protein
MFSFIRLEIEKFGTQRLANALVILQCDFEKKQKDWIFDLPGLP